jgi:hypothetical protein
MRRTIESALRAKTHGGPRTIIVLGLCFTLETRFQTHLHPVGKAFKFDIPGKSLFNEQYYALHTPYFIMMEWYEDGRFPPKTHHFVS